MAQGPGSLSLFSKRLIIMDKIKIYVVGTVYTSWIVNYEIVDNLEDATIVLFTGGEDVDPSLYNEEKYPETQSDLEHDLKEKNIFDKIKTNQLVIGCGRGAQFLCVMNGGKLIQDCTGHMLDGTHQITNGSVYCEITSTHHQMQYPFNLFEEDYTILYRAAPELSYHYECSDTEHIYCEPEIVLYHKEGFPKCLAIQGHPEYMRKESPVIEILNNIIKSCLEDL